ncbi:MAG TPA: NADH-quinone oxidoreductase subunit L [Gammaproteobacteria bacterium]|nr:NADH-quinone oxidoreductase subunit L [Gammaproteobacteria bacterium]
MNDSLTNLTLGIILAPLFAGLIAGVFGNRIGRVGAHSITILGVFISFVLSMIICDHIFWGNISPLNSNIYTWGLSGNLNLSVGFLIDRLSAAMMGIVSFISLVVHIYSIGYMKDDNGYQRFFSYISLFTFAMLMLVSANNFLQLYFGWEGVGLVSYLLIGFWFNKESANFGSLKAFLVNRVGDFGFLLGIAAILRYTGSLDFATVFGLGSTLPVHQVTVICLLLFVGAMGKSAQMPLHIWLPESMEGPTPISALIHAATMVTAGIYMVARMSPLYEYSTTALSTVLIIGATGALFTGILALVQNDIKRVVAYSTLSQLGYMVAALGASAYSVAIFHLITHAFFKALLFLAAGSVIIAMHHEQDMRHMGGLRKYMPVTYICFLIGALALCAIPPFAGFFSKDLIIDAVEQAKVVGSHYAYYCVLIGAFVTPLYTFRALFLTFHGKERFSEETRGHIHESPWIVLFPLILLAIPSVIAGAYLITPLVFNNGFGSSIFILPDHALELVMPSLYSLSLLFAVGGIIVAWIFYIIFPTWPAKLSETFSLLYRVLILKYGFDWFNEHIIVPGVRFLATTFYKVGDEKIVDDTLVNGSGRLMTKLSHVARKLQSGYLYHYAFLMLAGLLILLYWILLCPC